MPSSTARRRLIIALLLSIGMITAYLDRTALSIALVLDEFKRFFHLTNADRGLLNSAFFWSYALLQIPAGWVVDRYGVKRPYAIGYLFWGAISAATALARNVWELVGIRVLLGVGESVVAPASLRWIRVNCPEHERGLMVGIYMAGTKIGPAAGAPLAAWLIQAYGWRPMFILMGLVPLLWLLPWKLLVADDAPDKHGNTAANAMPFAPVLRSPALWGILVATFCYGCYLYFCMTWLPAYFVERRKFSLGLMGLYTMFSFTGMAIMTIVAGWTADRFIRRGYDAVTVRKNFTIAGFLIASTEVFGAMSNSAPVAVAFAIISLTGLGLATANYFALTQTLFPRELIGRIAGVQNAASNLAGAVAPWFTGVLIERTASYAAPMGAISAALIVGALCYVVLVRRPKLQAAAAQLPVQP